jgi:crotonobetainyl-CoA:carnitine CoA-transferase CaiB-like acyl-CoA transferase
VRGEQDPFLTGMTVVELGDGVAGSVATTMLRLLGASVIKVVGESRWVDRVGSSLVPTSSAARSLLGVVLDRDKDVVVDARSDDVATLLERADLVIDDQVRGVDDVADYVESVRRRNSSVWVTIAPFGLAGPRSGHRGSELVAQASGGLLATIESTGGGEPVSAPGVFALRAVGHVVALAALHGLDLQRGGEAPVHIEVSAQEAVIFTGALPECAHLVFRCPGQAGSGRYVAPSGLFPCLDGLVRIAAIEDHQWKGLVECLGGPAWTNGLEMRAARAEHAAMITEKVRAWTRDQDKASCADQLQRHGVPSTPVNGPAEILRSTQFAARGFLAPEDLGAGIEALVPVAPWTTRTIERDPANRVAASPRGDRRRVEGLRVTELTHVLAGPIVGSLLGAMGADVVRLEDTRRLDLYRRTGPFADGIAGLERGAYFAVANFSKRSVAAGIDDIDEAVERLLERTDVVIENVGLSRLERLGVVPIEVARTRDAIVLHVSGFGTTGPLSDYKVYANNVQAYGGLAALTLDADGEPARLGSVLADPLSSVVGATVIAAWALGGSPVGTVVDLSMSEVVATTIAEFVAAASLGIDATIPHGNEMFPFAPHGVYATRDGRWVALAIESDEEWTIFLEVLGQPPSLARDEWRSAIARWESRAEIDEAIAAVALGADADVLAARWAGAGLRASGVSRAVDLLSEAHLESRGFFAAIDHPDLGATRIVGLPWRRAGAGPFDLGAPPRLGDANAAFSLPTDVA